MNKHEHFLEATSMEMSVGCQKTGKGWECLICGEIFEDGMIYPLEEKLYDASRAVKEHVRQKHGSLFEYLIALDKKYTGLTPHQISVLGMMQRGLSDKEIVEHTTATSTATIRNLRFQMKEREKQAKVFLAIMEALRNEQISIIPDKKSEKVEIHKGATMVDDRYQATKTEQEETIKHYFRSDGTLINFPAKEKKKILVLKELTKLFETGHTYHEKEVSAILQVVFEDFASLRRYLIEYGFMERNRDGSAYKLKE